MDAQEHLRHAIDQAQQRLRESVPIDREAALLALLRARDRQEDRSESERRPDLVTGRRLGDVGGNLALQLCLEATADNAHGVPIDSASGWDDWAEHFLALCAGVAETELVLAHCETGFMRLADDGDRTFDAWITTRRAPASWRERADVDWWAAWLAREYGAELRRAALTPSPSPIAMGEGSAAVRQVSDRDHSHSVSDGDGGGDHVDYDRLAEARLKLMAYQLGYPAEATIGGCTMQTYGDVLRVLIAWALRVRDRGDAMTPQSEHDLVAALASALAVDPAVAREAVTAFTLDRVNVAWHAATPGVAAAPLVRVAPDRLVCSLTGLTTEPLFFLTRELRRRDAQEYHNSAHLREDVFRQDVYALFADTRFVTSASRIALRREGGDVRTDIDAAVFDRKTGTLGLFELKSQDPFARSPAEQARQRDNLLYANRQLSGVLTWLNRHGGDAVLARFDARTAKRFRVQKVYPFVLGRYLVPGGDGPEPDPRAAWGTWPQVLRLLEGPPSGSTANPIASLFTRLKNDTPLASPIADAARREITCGDATLIVHPSYAAFQASTGSR